VGSVPVHRPVLVDEVLKYLVTDRAGCYADLTLGGGGHAEAILLALAEAGTLIGLDRDPAALRGASARLARFAGRVELVAGRASDLTSILAVRGIEQVDGVLLDLGLSSDQLASARGFSFEGDAPLDMRFDPESESESAAELLGRIGELELTQLFERYGEFSRGEARRYARRLIAARERGPLTRVAAVREALLPVPPPRRAQTLARLFQALRIQVNDELSELDRALDAASESLRHGGVLCVIAYHSLEDRKVKELLRGPAAPRRDLPPPPGWPAPRFAPLVRRAVRPTSTEIAANPRARSARLRAGVRQRAGGPAGDGRTVPLHPREGR
jgi:16S rRNA (cytosine1402-N4)-methyltransferase